jgi:hypothetical protein
MYYAGVEGSGGVWSATNPSAECLANVISTGGTGPNDTSVLDAALLAGNVARFNYIVPNECEDGHDNCKPVGNNIEQFDAFLAREIPKIQASPAFGTDGVIVVVYDEGQGQGPNYADNQPAGFGGGNVELAVMSPLVQPSIYAGLHNHYGLLRTLEDGFGISDHPAGAGSVGDQRDLGLGGRSQPEEMGQCLHWPSRSDSPALLKVRHRAVFRAIGRVSSPRSSDPDCATY